MSEPTFDPTPRPALQPRPRPEPVAEPEAVPAPVASEPVVSEPVVSEPAVSEPAVPEPVDAPAPAVRVKVAEPARSVDKTAGKGKKKRKVDGKRFGRGSTADTQLAPKAKRVKVKVSLPKALRTELADEAAELGIPVDDYVTNILRSR